MKDKQCKQIKRFSTITTGNNYFFVLDDKSKQRYKVKINIIEVYDPYQIKNIRYQNFQAILVNSHQWQIQI